MLVESLVKTLRLDLGLLVLRFGLRYDEKELFHRGKRLLLRRWLFWLLVAIFFIFLIRNAGQIEDVVTVILSGNLTWLGVALILQAVYFLLYTRLYQSSFEVLDLKFGFWETFPYVLASMAINVAAPTGGTASTMLFMDHAAHKGESSGKAAAGTIIVYVAHLGVLAVLVGVTLAYLASINQLQEYQLAATVLFLIFILFFMSLLWMAMRTPRFFRRLLKMCRSGLNFLGRVAKKEEVIAEVWLEENVVHFTDAAHAINHHTDRLQTPLLVAIAMHVVNAISLFMVFTAFGVTTPAEALLVTYAMSQLFMVVSPTPQGIGVVEGVMALVLGSLGMNAGIATVVALAYRGVAFWLPLGVGAILLKHVKAFDARPEKAIRSNPTITEANHGNS